VRGHEDSPRRADARGERRDGGVGVVRHAMSRSVAVGRGRSRSVAQRREDATKRGS